MSQRDGFGAGFLAGTIFGSIVGGVVGAMLASRMSQQNQEAEAQILSETTSETKPEKGRKRQLEGNAEQRIEMARRSLEEKIAQLNQTIDEARQQLVNVNGTTKGNGERLSKGA